MREQRLGVVASRPSPPKRNLQINCNALTNSNLCRDAIFSINPVQMQSSAAKGPEQSRVWWRGGGAFLRSSIIPAAFVWPDMEVEPDPR